MFSEDAFVRRHKVLSGIAIVLLLALSFLGCRLQGPYRSYKLDFVTPPAGTQTKPGVLEAGVAKRDITPNMDLYDPWTDVNNNGRYEPKKGDSYTDRNGNHKFDGVWIAGFSFNRPAKGVHDRLWARALAFRNNGVTVVLVSTDTIGMFIEEYIAIRKSLDPALGIDHVAFSSEHIHEVPDTMGLWSYPVPFFSKDKKHMAFVRQMCKEAVEEAVRNLQPAEMTCAEPEMDPVGFVDDSREPYVIDKRVRCARFVKPGSDETIATMVCWGNHPETLGSDNPLLTADFIYYLREGMEQGVPDPKGVKGLGGTCVYFQGPLGGLMTQLHTTVPHRNGVDQFKEGTFEKAQALGENLAIVCATSLRGGQTWVNKDPKVAVAAKTIYVPVSGLMRLGILLGVAHPGWYWGKARSEVNVIRIGEVEILTCPGELYPEIAVGGVEAPEGRDYPIQPIEAPPLFDLMSGRMKMVFGLANDEIGYMLPKSQWDTKRPFAYGREKAQYGEENSAGPEVGPTYYREAAALLQRMIEAF